jgi:hypothetical protein
LWPLLGGVTGVFTTTGWIHQRSLFDSVHLTDAYLFVPMHPIMQQFLRFTNGMVPNQFQPLPFWSKCVSSGVD